MSNVLQSSPNATVVAQLYQAFQNDPKAVDPLWSGFFADLDDEARALLAGLNGGPSGGPDVAANGGGAEAVAAGVDAGRHKAPADAKGRNALRVAIRELAQQTGNSDIIDAWRTRFDRV